jgi:hypothetical protein
MTAPATATDFLSRFAAIYDALGAEHETWSAAAWLRFAAFSAVLQPGDPKSVAHSIRTGAESLRKHASWYEGLASPMRFVIAAMLQQAGGDARRFAKEVEEVRARLHETGLRSGSVRGWDVVAAVLLHVMNGGQPLSPLQAERIKAIYDGMKRHHWWLTGPDDLPACILLSFRPDSAKDLTEDAERLYQLLRTRGFTGGDGLQTAANLLVLTGLPTVVAAKRANDIASAARGRDLYLIPGDYGILAALCLLDHDLDLIARRISEYHSRLAKLDPPLPAAICITLASDLAFLDLVRQRRDGSMIGDPQGLQEMLRLVHLHHGIAVILAMSVADAGLATSYPPVDIAWPYGPV